jgi:hypothetical protein
MNWWQKEPLRIFEIANWATGMDEAESVESVCQFKANVQHVHCMESSGGLNENGMLFSTTTAKVSNRDFLKDYLPEAHKRGVKAIVYFNVHYIATEYGNEHLDWLQIKEDNSYIDDVYGAATSFCINSPWRQWVFQIIRDLGKYEIDGIFYDGPIFFADTCYCQYCQELFQKKYNHTLPLKSDKVDPLWKDFIEFQSDSIARFLKDSRDIMRGVRPEALLYMNGNSYWPSWPTGRDNRKLIQYTDILGAEGGFLHGDLSKTSIFKPGITAKLLESQCNGKPTVVFDCPGHKPWSLYLLPEAEIGLLHAQTIANGANVWLALFPGDSDQPETAIVERYNSFIKKNSDVYMGTKSSARIALLWPSRTANFYNGSSVPVTDFTKKITSTGIGDVAQEFNGFYDALVRNHLTFDVIDEEVLSIGSSELQAKYDLIILPNAACLSGKDVKSIDEFVENGGNIVSTFETSLYDECGKRLPDFQLNKVLGLNFSGQVIGPIEWDYITGLNNYSELLEGITKARLPSPRYGISVESAKAEKHMSFYERMDGRYDDLPEVSNNPFLLVNRYGKGKALYLAGTFGEMLCNYNFKEYYQLVGNMGRLLSRQLVVIENAPASVEVVLREKDNRFFIHLINFTSEMKRPMEKIIPVTEIGLNLRCDFKPYAVTAMWLDKELDFINTSDGIAFTIPVVNGYEVIVVETS